MEGRRRKEDSDGREIVLGDGGEPDDIFHDKDKVLCNTARSDFPTRFVGKNTRRKRNEHPSLDDALVSCLFTHDDAGL